MPVKIYIKPPDTKYVAKVIIFDEAGDVLLLKRKKNQKYPEQWDLPGGHLIQGESWTAAATREVKEETNLSIDNLEKVFESDKTTYFKTADYQGDIFDNGNLPEHDEYRWTNPNKIDELNNVGDIYVDAIKRSIA